MTRMCECRHFMAILLFISHGVQAKQCGDEEETAIVQEQSGFVNDRPTSSDSGIEIRDVAIDRPT